MWLQHYTNYLLRHRWVALILTFLVSFIPIIGIIGVLFAALVTLLRGVLEGALFTIAASLPFILSFFGSSAQGSPPLVVWAAVGVAVLSNAFTWIFAILLRRQASWSVILQTSALVGVLVVSVIHLIYPDVANWWGKELQAYYGKAAIMANGVFETPASTATEAQLEVISTTKQYATGLMATVILFNALMQLIVARWWQAFITNQGLLRRELHGVRLSQLAGALFMIGLVFWYLGNSVVLDIMPVLYLLFGGAGLSLIHYLFGQMNSPTAWFWLLLLYVTLIIALPASALVISMLALIDIWIDLRKRIRKV